MALQSDGRFTATSSQIVFCMALVIQWEIDTKMLPEIMLQGKKKGKQWRVTGRDRKTQDVVTRSQGQVFFFSFLQLLCTVETTGIGNRAFCQTKLEWRRGVVTLQKVKHYTGRYHTSRNTWAELKAINAQSSERCASLKVEQVRNSSLTVSLQANESSANLKVDLLDQVLITASYEHKRIIAFHCTCALFIVSSATES